MVNNETTSSSPSTNSFDDAFAALKNLNEFCASVNDRPSQASNGNLLMPEVQQTSNYPRQIPPLVPVGWNGAETAGGGGGRRNSAPQHPRLVNILSGGQNSGEGVSQQQQQRNSSDDSAAANSHVLNHLAAGGRARLDSASPRTLAAYGSPNSSRGGLHDGRRFVPIAPLPPPSDDVVRGPLAVPTKYRVRTLNMGPFSQRGAAPRSAENAYPFVKNQGPKLNSPGDQVFQAPIAPKNVELTNQRKELSKADQSLLSFENHVPYRFEPPPPGADRLPVPAHGHRCLECGDSYATKTCLQFHQQRRSLIIAVRCSLCKSPLTFYNKCAYHAHVRWHRDCAPNRSPSCQKSPDVAAAHQVYDEVTVKQIEWPVLEQWFEDTAFQRLCDPEAFFLYEFGSATSSEKTASKPDPFPVEIEDITPTAVMQQPKNTPCKCPECGCEFSDGLHLQRHVTHNAPVQRKQLICTTCHAVYFSRCGFAAHQRYAHSETQLEKTADTVYMCPECGLTFQTTSELSKHLNSHVQKPTTFVSYRCPQCFTFYSCLDALKFHVVAAHFATTDRSNPNARIKCCFCQSTVPRNRDVACEHARDHLERVRPFTLYRCAPCGRLMENADGLRAHMRNVHSGLIMGGGGSSSSSRPQQSPAAAGSRTAGKNAGSVQTGPNGRSPASGRFSGGGNHFVAHLMNVRMFDAAAAGASNDKVPPPPNVCLNQRADYSRRDCTAVKSLNAKDLNVSDSTLYTCLACSNVFNDWKGCFEHGRAVHLSKGRFICLLCDNSPFNDSQGLLHHLKQHSQQQPAFTCNSNHCNVNFTDSTSALNHLYEMHGLLGQQLKLKVAKEKKRTSIEMACDILAKKACQKLADIKDTPGSQSTGL